MLEKLKSFIEDFRDTINKYEDPVRLVNLVIRHTSEVRGEELTAFLLSVAYFSDNYKNFKFEIDSYKSVKLQISSTEKFEKYDLYYLGTLESILSNRLDVSIIRSAITSWMRTYFKNLPPKIVESALKNIPIVNFGGKIKNIPEIFYAQ